MRRLTLTPSADLSVFYDADAHRYLASRSPVTARVTREAFIDFFAGAASIGFACDGRPIGGIIFDGTRAHIAVLPEFHGRWALLFKPALQWLFALKAEIFVEVEADNTPCIRFLERHGWPCVERREGELVYLLKPRGGHRKTEYPFMRSSPRRGAGCSAPGDAMAC